MDDFRGEENEQQTASTAGDEQQPDQGGAAGDPGVDSGTGATETGSEPPPADAGGDQEPADPWGDTPHPDTGEGSEEQPVSTEQAAAEAAAEKLLAGKFKTPEEIEQAYVELERKLGQQGEELGRLRSQVTAPVNDIPDDPEIRTAILETAKLKPADAAMSQEAVDFAFEVLGYSEEQIAAADDPLFWDNVVKQARSYAGALEETAAASDEEMQQQLEEYARVTQETFYGEHPYLEDFKPYVADANAILLREHAQRGNPEWGATPEEAWTNYSNALAEKTRQLAPPRLAALMTPAQQAAAAAPAQAASPVPALLPGASNARGLGGGSLAEKPPTPEELAQW